MKFTTLVMLLGAATASSSSSSSSSGSDDQKVQLGCDGSFQAFPPSAHVDPASFLIEPGDYVRQLPARFSTDDDDIFMRSMIMSYAVEEKTPCLDEVTNPGGAPTGKFWLTRSGARAAAAEVLATHKGLTGAALGKYLDTYFEKAFNHFDVNLIGRIEVSKASQFMRFLASDQYFQFMYPK